MKAHLKKKMIILCLTIMASGHLMAIDWGFKLGISRMGYFFSDKDFPVDRKFRSELIIGAFMDFQILKRLSVQTEIYVPVTKGMDFFDDHKWLLSHRVYYLELPVLLKYKIPFRGDTQPAIFMGAYYGYKMDSDTINIWDDFNDFMIDDQGSLEDSLKEHDYGLIIGGSLELETCFATLIVDARYGLGLANILKDGDDYARTLRSSDAFMNNKILSNRSFLILFGLSF